MRKVVIDVSRSKEKKKQPSHSTKVVNAEVTIQSRKRKWWVVLSNVKLYFYEIYGDSKPKFVADIAETTPSVLTDKSHHIPKISIHHIDQHIWNLEFTTYEELKFFLEPLLASKACLDLEGSPYMQLETLLAGRNQKLGFQ